MKPRTREQKLRQFKDCISEVLYNGCKYSYICTEAQKEIDNIIIKLTELDLLRIYNKII